MPEIFAKVALGLGVFAVLFVLDAVWVYYTKLIISKKPAMSGLMAAGLYLLSGLATLGYTREPWLLLPAVAGAFAGTFWAVRRA